MSGNRGQRLLGHLCKTADRKRCRLLDALNYSSQPTLVLGKRTFFVPGVPWQIDQVAESQAGGTRVAIFTLSSRTRRELSCKQSHPIRRHCSQPLNGGIQTLLAGTRPSGWVP